MHLSIVFVFVFDSLYDQAPYVTLPDLLTWSADMEIATMSNKGGLKILQTLMTRFVVIVAAIQILIDTN